MVWRIIGFIVFTLIILLPDIYIYFSKVHLAFPSERAKRIGKILYFSAFALQFGGMLFLYFYLKNGGVRNMPVNILQAFVWMMFIIKGLVIVPILLFGDIYKFVEYIIKWTSKAEMLPERVASRRTFVKQFSIIVASVPFFTFLHGMTFGKYNFKVRNVKLTFDDLPKAFNGFKVAQFSDFHAGSFDSISGVRKGLRILQEQAADVILFTGDLVNQMADEVDPYKDEFKILDAPYGQYACTGNHDYGYRGEESRTDENKANIKEKFGECNMTLLNNTHVKLEKDGEHIRLMGVEKWGAARYFPKEGDLDGTLSDIPAEDFKILMSHDPTHWDSQVKGHDKKVHLTLSGHTHGAQMGVELLGMKWSPGKYIYKKWAGLYGEAGRFLYVNRGFGMLEGFSFRAGIYPEITVFELVRGES
jgi:predicted MPP superfamily phosphohydrolase